MSDAPGVFVAGASGLLGARLAVLGAEPVVAGTVVDWSGSALFYRRRARD